MLAFEKLKLRDNLSKIEHIEEGDLSGYLQAFESHDELESQLYYEISKGRLDIIKSFEDLSEEVRDGARRCDILRKCPLKDSNLEPTD